jgi:septal ring factor EnvC (AmiA/AmiB activator)
MPNQSNLSASTDLSTLSSDSDIGKVLQLRWKKMEKAAAKQLVDFDKPLGDLLGKCRAALEEGQKQIPSKTLNHYNVGDICRRRRSEAERLSRDWDIEVSHLDGKTVGELAASGKWSSSTALFAAVDKPEREAKASEKKAAKEAAKAEAEAEETAEAEAAAKPMTADEIAFEAMVLCSVNRISDADFIAALKKQITIISVAA